MQLVRNIQAAVLTAAVSIVGVGLVAPTQASAAAPTTASSSRSVGQARAVAPTFESEVLRLTNRERGKRGLGALRLAPCTEKTSTRWARSMAARNAFHHQSIRSVARTCGNRYVGENIAMGRPLSAARVVYLWMHSAGHRRNILNRKYHYLGVGAARSARTGAIYVVQNFRS